MVYGVDLCRRNRIELLVRSNRCREWFCIPPWAGSIVEARSESVDEPVEGPSIEESDSSGRRGQPMGVQIDLERFEPAQSERGGPSL